MCFLKRFCHFVAGDINWNPPYQIGILDWLLGLTPSQKVICQTYLFCFPCCLHCKVQCVHCRPEKQKAQRRRGANHALTWKWMKMAPFGGFLKWWYPTTMGFPTKNDHFGVFRGYRHVRKHSFKENNLYSRVSVSTSMIGESKSIYMWPWFVQCVIVFFLCLAWPTCQQVKMMILLAIRTGTLPKFNIAPQNIPSQ